MQPALSWRRDEMLEDEEMRFKNGGECVERSEVEIEVGEFQRQAQDQKWLAVAGYGLVSEGGGFLGLKRARMLIKAPQR